MTEDRRFCPGSSGPRLGLLNVGNTCLIEEAPALRRQPDRKRRRSRGTARGRQTPEQAPSPAILRSAGFHGSLSDPGRTSRRTRSPPGGPSVVGGGARAGSGSRGRRILFDKCLGAFVRREVPGRGHRWPAPDWRGRRCGLGHGLGRDRVRVDSLGVGRLDSGLAPASGQGGGEIKFQVAPNPTIATRQAEISLNGAVPRSPSPARRAASKSRRAVRPSRQGRNGTVTVTALTGCPWMVATTHRG